MYATLPTTPNATLAFGPGGTIYVWNDAQIAKISGTNVTGPPSISNLPGFQLNNLGLLAGGTQSNGDATFLIENPFLNGTAGGIDSLDLTTTPPTRSTTFATASGANFMTFGPDGCIYAAQGTTVFRVTDTSGDCSYGTTTLGTPTLVLSPTSVSPNPSQGTAQTFNATIHYAERDGGNTGAIHRHRRQSTKQARERELQWSSVVHLYCAGAGSGHDRGYHDVKRFRPELQSSDSNLGLWRAHNEPKSQPESNRWSVRADDNPGRSVSRHFG